MNPGQIRGYVLTNAVVYLRKTAGERRAKELFDALPHDVRESIEGGASMRWCPCAHLAHVYRAIASLSDGDEERARAALIQCGTNAANEASSTFLKLFMKVLTPSLFAKKLPEIWARDCTVGKVIANVQDDRLTNRYVEVGGFDHIAPVAVGYVTYALTMMGKTVTKSVLNDWSLATPAPETFSFEVHWKS